MYVLTGAIASLMPTRKSAGFDESTESATEAPSITDKSKSIKRQERRSLQNPANVFEKELNRFTMNLDGVMHPMGGPSPHITFESCGCGLRTDSLVQYALDCFLVGNGWQVADDG